MQKTSTTLRIRVQIVEIPLTETFEYQDNSAIVNIWYVMSFNCNIGLYFFHENI